MRERHLRIFLKIHPVNHFKLQSTLSVFFLFIFIIFNSLPDFLLANGVPVINEIMASNNNTLADRDGDFPDWIEIYNPGGTTINLENWALSDDENQPRKWIFPTTNLAPGGIKLIFASGKNYVSEAPFFHTNFKIKASGEALILSDSVGSVVDRIITGTLATDLSWGRQPDGAADWYFFNAPTPDASNTSTGFSAFPDPVEFSHPGGFYNNTISLELRTNSPSAEIRYTSDYSEPTLDSRLYTGPISITRTGVVRARTFETGLLPGKVASQTFIFNENITLPVISLATNREHLFDNQTGIYINYWDDWERPIHFEMFEPDGRQVVNVDAGIKIGGGLTRRRPQKAFRIYFRSEYGANNVHYQFFPDMPVFDFSTLFLRNSGNDWDQAHFRDGFIQTLVRDLDIDTQAFRSSVIFLNGQYWGILNIRERLTEDYLAAHYSVDPDNVDLLEIVHTTSQIQVIEGDADKFDAMYNFIIENNLSQKEAYQQVQTLLDVSNFMDYVITEIYSRNMDWPTNNVKIWREKTENSKFRFMLFDLDWSYGYSQIRQGERETYKANTLTRALDPDGLYIPRILTKLLENDSFKHEFINRFAEYFNTIFAPQHALEVMHRLQAILEPEMQRHYDRFKTDPISVWYQSIEIMEEFAQKRPRYIRQYIQDYFNLSDTVRVNLDISSDGGNIKIHNLRVKEFPWTGTYFTDVPVEICAEPKIGFRFTGWSGASSENAPSITVNLTADISLTANFESDPSMQEFLVINEINYNSAGDFDTEDWLELYNPGDNTIDLTDWILTKDDETAGFLFPSNTIIGPNEYLVICRNQEKFHQYFPKVTNYSGDLNFALSNGGDKIKLYNNGNQLIDSVCYNDTFPWPPGADGNGPTLMLRESHLDNAQPENWQADNNHGTPGRFNQLNPAAVQNNKSMTVTEFQLAQNYPNPFNSATRIGFSLPRSGKTTLKIYNILGHEVATLLNDFQEAGSCEILWEARNYTVLPSGIYFAQLKTEKYSQTIRMLYLR